MMTTFTTAEQLGLALMALGVVGLAILGSLGYRGIRWRLENLEHFAQGEAEARKVQGRRLTELERQSDALVVAIAAVEDGRTVLTGHVIDLAETLGRTLNVVDMVTPRKAPAARRKART